MIFSFLKSGACSIGVDISDDSLKLAQLASKGEGVSLIAGQSERCPEDIKPGSAAWQRWAVESIREATANHGFRGRNVIAAISASDVFIDHVKVGKQLYGESKANDEKLSKVILSRIKQKLPFEPDEAVIKFIPINEDNILVMATERKIIDRHLAIYEKAGLAIKSIGVWPVALATCYTKFFGRRKADLEAIVMLLDVRANCTNLVICRHKDPLFACSIPIGAKQLEDETLVTRLIFELTTCRRQFASMHRNAQIERLIFLSGPALDKDTYTAIAMQMKIQAQMGDCLAALEIGNPFRSGIDRRNGSANVNWATAFGLSLSAG
jgi:Tfp pilus assembly PilM family ATPase